MNPVEFLTISTLALIVFLFLVSRNTRRAQRRNLDQIDVSMEMTRRSLALHEERVELARETNRLLQELIETIHDPR